MRYLMALVGMLSVAASAQAALNGNQALDMMTGSYQKELHLMTYVSGIFDQEEYVVYYAKALAQANINAPMIRPFCVPPQVTFLQGMLVLKHALESEPANNHKPLIVITRNAFTKAWPCTPEGLAK